MKYLVSIIIITAMFITAFIALPFAPDQMMIHWNAQGEADGYAGQFMGLFLMPIITLAIFLLFIAIPKIAVYKQNIQKFKNYYEYFILAFTLFFAILYTATLLANFNYPINISGIVTLSIAALFYLISIILPKTKRNFFIGIRTPWTLSNDEVWKKTHKQGAIAFKIFALFMILAFIFPNYFLWLILVPVLTGVLYLFVYSYIIYNKLAK